jgi:ribosomal protein S18 acetylase RimI-like enzyme
MELIKTNDSEYQNAIITLYVDAFSIGQSQQYIDIDELHLYINLILKEGYSILAIENNEVLGAVLICPLSLDKSLPLEISRNNSIERSLYVAEMMVNEKIRGRGIGKLLMDEFFKTADKSAYSDVFIRVWDENIPALNLYRKMGFEPVTTIEQTKMKVDGSGTFVMKKIYLHKKLD